MKFLPLLELSLRHAYYSDGRCPDFVIAPDAETGRWLEARRCLLRCDADCLRVLTPLDGAGQLLIPASATSTLGFELTLRNPDFPLFTDLSELPANASPIYVPSSREGDAPGQLVVAANGGPSYRDGRFARIEVPCPVGSDGRSPAPAAYHLPFPAQKLRWAYYCITAASTDSTQLHIVDAAPSGTSELLSFPDENRADLSSEPDPTDATAVQLLLQHPTLRCVRFLSDQPISCRQQPRPYLELRLGEERLVGPLPNPSPHSVAGGVLLFRVIKYRTQPLLTQ